MRRYQVGYAWTAEEDLRAIADWITDVEGDAVALGYVTRIRAFCARLDMFPERGTRLRCNLRRIGFERRCAILFSVGESSVNILRVLYGGRHAPEVGVPIR